LTPVLTGNCTPVHSFHSAVISDSGQCCHLKRKTIAMFRLLTISIVAAVLIDQTAVAGSSLAPSSSPYDHNGSRVSVDPQNDQITYDEPRPALADVVSPDDVLFQGHIHFPGTPEPDKTTHGIAYAFKKGCAPAPYPVTGSWSADRSTLILRGPGPVRSGCAVTGSSQSSPHSVLKFVSMMSP